MWLTQTFIVYVLVPVVEEGCALCSVLCVSACILPPRKKKKEGLKQYKIQLKFLITYFS